MTSENAPPPINPKLQKCIEEINFQYYEEQEPTIRKAVNAFSIVNIDYLPEKYIKGLKSSQQQVLATFELVDEINNSEIQFNQFIEQYYDLHHKVRKIESEIRKIEDDIDNLKKSKILLESSESIVDSQEINRINVITSFKVAEFSNFVMKYKIRHLQDPNDRNEHNFRAEMAFLVKLLQNFRRWCKCFKRPM